jgi:G3E family GTPase
MMPRDTIPVTVLTGFLGSGKTTVLNHLLSRPELADTVVIINEFGEIGLDHLLVSRSSENLTLLNNGCLCCTVRGDLIETFTDLAARQARGDIGPYRRIVVETTGLADPAPILHTLMADPAVTARHRLEGVITTVDAVNGEQTLDVHPEALKQAAVADRLLLTKSDIASVAASTAVRRKLGVLNGGTPVLDVVAGMIDPSEMFNVGLYDSRGKSADVRRWLNEESFRPGHRGHHPDADGAHQHHHDHDVNRHDQRIRAHCVTIDEPVSWSAFSYWLELMAALRGEQMLRLKGIVSVADHPDRPIVVHGVQHVFHPPLQLEAWPSPDKRTRLVFITRDMPVEVIEKTLEKFGRVDRADRRPVIPAVGHA